MKIVRNIREKQKEETRRREGYKQTFVKMREAMSRTEEVLQNCKGED